MCVVLCVLLSLYIFRSQVLSHSADLSPFVVQKEVISAVAVVTLSRRVFPETVGEAAGSSVWCHSRGSRGVRGRGGGKR